MILNIKSMVSQTGCLMPVIMLKRSTKQLARGSSVSHWKRKQNSWLALAAQADMEPLAKLWRGTVHAADFASVLRFRPWDAVCRALWQAHTHVWGHTVPGVLSGRLGSCNRAADAELKASPQSWRRAPSCSAGLAPGSVTSWSWQRVACCPRHHEATGSSWPCIKNTAEKGSRWGAWSPGSDHYGPRVCRKGTHCCQRPRPPTSAQSPGSRRQRAVRGGQVNSELRIP